MEVNDAVGLQLKQGCMERNNQTLREKIYQEIEQNSRRCAYPNFFCTLACLDGFEYCIRHILCDSSNKCYGQCVYVFPNRKRCLNAVLKYDEKGKVLNAVCQEHDNEGTVQTVKPENSMDTKEKLLQQLTLHLNMPQHNKTSLNTDEVIDVTTMDDYRPFLGYKNLRNMHALSSLRGSNEHFTSSSSAVTEKLHRFEALRQSEDWSDSETDELGTDDEDCLKHAGIFSQEEVVRIAQTKLTHLRNLHVQEIEALRRKMISVRRRYLLECSQEYPKSCSKAELNKLKTNDTQLKLLQKFRRHSKGPEGLMRWRYKEKSTRAQNVAITDKLPATNVCTFIDHTVKCDDNALALSKYCRRHITEDKRQVLFKSCGATKGDLVCQETVIDFKHNARCLWHRKLASKTQSKKPIVISRASTEPAQHQTTEIECVNNSYYDLLEQIQATL